MGEYDERRLSLYRVLKAMLPKLCYHTIREGVAELWRQSALTGGELRGVTAHLGGCRLTIGTPTGVRVVHLFPYATPTPTGGVSTSRPNTGDWPLYVHRRKLAAETKRKITGVASAGRTYSVTIETGPGFVRHTRHEHEVESADTRADFHFVGPCEVLTSLEEVWDVEKIEDVNQSKGDQRCSL